MMFSADLGRAVLTAVIPISVWLGGPTLALILLVTFPMNALRVLWLAAFTAAVPGLVGRGQIARANAIFEAFFNIGWIVGPALAGFSPPRSARAPRSRSTPSPSRSRLGRSCWCRRPLRPAARTEPTHLLADIREGIAYVARQPTLRAVLALWTTVSVINAGLTSGLIFYVTIDRGLGSDVVGLVLSAFAVGMLGGSLIAARMAFRAVGAVMLVGNVVMGITLVIVATDAPVLSRERVVQGSSTPTAYLVPDPAHAASPDALSGGRDGADALVGFAAFTGLVAGILLTRSEHGNARPHGAGRSQGWPRCARCPAYLRACRAQRRDGSRGRVVPAVVRPPRAPHADAGARPDLVFLNHGRSGPARARSSRSRPTCGPSWRLSRSLPRARARSRLDAARAALAPSWAPTPTTWRSCRTRPRASTPCCAPSSSARATSS
jgi:hypothetical protein